MINISSETPHHNKIETDIIKAAVAGDYVTGRLPYKLPVKFKPFAKHFLAMNETPHIDDPTYGMWRRICVLNFPKVFSEDEMDVDLTEKLKSELSGIFNWALDGYKRLKRNGFKFNSAESMQFAKQNMRNEGNSFLLFLNENIIKTDDVDTDRIPLKDVFHRYLKFCEEEGIKSPLSKINLKSNLIREGYSVDNSTKDGNQVVVFGAKLKNV